MHEILNAKEFFFNFIKSINCLYYKGMKLYSKYRIQLSKIMTEESLHIINIEKFIDRQIDI